MNTHDSTNSIKVGELVGHWTSEGKVIDVFRIYLWYNIKTDVRWYKIVGTTKHDHESHTLTKHIQYWIETKDDMCISRLFDNSDNDIVKNQEFFDMLEQGLIGKPLRYNNILQQLYG